ncbi:hypothetical protein [Edwardsiella tarda]|uniref:hypothetical protein n=1 Tax=Edwardsiella tarda TaxID=636 RepID=UPI0002DB8547|nr:hypothetical protein [Edwardsiella tarda]
MIFEGIALIGLCVAERFMLKRGGVTINNLSLDGSTADGEYYRFAMGYTAKKKLRHSVLQYELRDAKRPTTVIAGKTRTLDFAYEGHNDEFLLIRKSLVKESGTWLLNVRISTGGSRWNPFYKLFPIEASSTQPFRLEAGE